MLRFLLPLVCVLALAGASLFVGVSAVSWASLVGPEASDTALEVLLASRVPRTVALMLAGAGMAVCGLIMQMLARNKFVEPATAGTAESAILGILVITFFLPDLPVVVRMIFSAACALAGTALFLAILRRVPLRSPLVVPLVGIMLGGVIGAVTAFFAYRYDLLQSLVGWTTGDFSGVIRGRYELLYLSFGLTVLAYITADRFTVAGMGEDFTANLGLNYRRVVSLGLVIVSLVTAVVVVTCGMIPFLGLVVPNVISLMMGDNMRRSLPYVAGLGAGLVLACDIVGRLVIHPFEIPIGTMMGIIGSVVFLYLLLRKNSHAA